MARKKKLLRQLFLSYLLITLISLVLVTWYASRSLEESLLKQIKSDLETRAVLFGNSILSYFDPVNEKGIDLLCKEIGKSTSTRFTVILPWGKVVGDSDHDPAVMDNHLDRPEIAGALNAGKGESDRVSPSLQKRMMYVAVTLKRNQRTVALVRASLPLDSIGTTVKDVQLKIVLAGLILALVAALLGFLVFHRIRQPFEAMKRGAESLAKGDFRQKLGSSEWGEMDSLAQTMNQMAAELQHRINLITAQRNELEAVLSSMVEGVIAVDMEERILSMNEAAGEIFGCNPLQARGRMIQEIIRNTDLQKFVSQALRAGDGAVEKDLVVYTRDGERTLNCVATALRDAESRDKGILVVLNDVTRLRKLENVRRDFVANVSHEIKTPITAIKGFVETLRDGASKNPEDADRFLQIVQKHVDRLETIVEDLLSLSRIEGEEERGEIHLEEHSIKEILQSALQVCQGKADPKQIILTLSCDEQVKARVNPPLMEHAILNLLDNAIKYSEAGKEVRVEVTEGEKEILIHVQDQGCGIDRAYLDRLFERFYRVDKARSRKLGGTGLGLAIVKHIMQAHAGRVSVKSHPGAGSTFTLHLPRITSNQP